jgi:arylsulfatase A-like enzyme
MLRAAVAAALNLAPAIAAQPPQQSEIPATASRAGAAAPAPRLTDGRPNLLLLTLDTTRADELAPWGSGGVAPNLDRLAGESLVAAVARAPAPLTLPSHTSMMTGLFPFAHGVRDNDLYHLSPKATTVAQLLHAAGWRTEAVVAATVLRAGSGLDLGFDHYDDLRYRRARNLAIEAERPANQVTDAALARLAVVDAPPDPRPWFLWVHYFDAHYPYAAPDGPPASAGRRAAYEAEIRFMDREIGRLIDSLKASGALARTWIVVCGDHGEGLGLQQELTHAYLCEEGTLRVPLFVRRPDGALRGTLEMAASTADVGPTLLGVAGLKFTADVHGRDLLAAFERQQRGGADAAADEDRALWFESWAGYHQFRWARLEGVIVGHFKYVRNVNDELFDLAAEPPATFVECERHDLSKERPEIVRALTRRFTLLQQEPVARLDSAAPTLAPAEAARLRELGYLARMVGEDDERDRGALDPRAHYHSYLELDLATTQAQQGNFAESVAALTKLAADYPKNPGFREFLGKVCFEARRSADAKRAFEEALALDPDLVSANFYLGVLARQSGDAVNARRLFERTLALAPGHLEARLQLRALRDVEREPAALLDDCLEVLAICDEMGDADAATIAASTLDEWLVKLLGRVAKSPDRAAIVGSARAHVRADPGPFLRRATELLDAELTRAH